MKKKMVVILSSVALLLTACGQSSLKEEMSGSSMAAGTVNNTAATDQGFSYGETYDEEYEMDAAESVEESAAGAVSEDKKVEAGAGNPEYRQKLIRSYSYSFETTEFDKSISFIEEQVTKYKGYIESSETYGSSRKTSYMKIRVPEDKAGEFLKEAGQIGEIIQKSESTEDITLKYYDAKARLASLNAQHDRLIELLGKAETLEDVVGLEQHISEIEYQIDSYGSQIKVYDNLVNYVTITINLSEVSQVQVVEEDSFWKKITKGLSRNTEDVIVGITAFIIFLITAIPYLIVIGIIVLIVIAIIKFVRKRKKRKAQDKVQVKNEEQEKELRKNRKE